MMRWLLMLALLGVGVAMAIGGGQRVFRAHASQGWPTVQGRVTGSRVRTTVFSTGTFNGGPDHHVYRPVVSYAYAVRGTPYTSDTLAFDGTGTGGPADAQAVSRQYRVGLPVTVHYDPDDPAVACLQCGRTEPVNHVVMLGGAVFVLVAIGNLVALARGAPGPARHPRPGRAP
ncbi:DUF3592 domain-containing protein [Corallococcus exercitus]|uniref:DUF3592 domain-containing protein n=1 Tax=Corallococcus exercitus TaxID=2316736 RepID=UPI0035D4D788